MRVWPEVLVIAAGAGLAAFFSGAETGAYVLNRIRLRHRARELGELWARRLEALLEDTPGFVTAMLIWTNAALYLTSAAGTSLYQRVDSRALIGLDPEFAATLTLALPVFILAELAPKNIFRVYAERTMAASARALTVAVRSIRPAARLFAAAGRGLRALLGLPEPLHWADVSRRAVMAHLMEGAGRGALSGPQGEFVENILRAGGMPALNAATPLADFPASPGIATAGSLVAGAAGLGGPRVAVYENERGRTTGIVHLVQAWAAAPEMPLSALATEPVRLDQGATVMRALGALKQARRTAAVLASGAEGNVLAVVTVEDLLRYLAGGPRVHG